MDTLISETDNLTVGDNPPPLPPPPQVGLTENLSPTFLSTGNPCLDFFFHVVPDTPPSDLTQRLCLAWTLKLVFNLRGVRGTGKSDKEGFYDAALWLHLHHPKTLALNVGALADFGYLKDLPEILYRLHGGHDVRTRKKKEWEVRKRGIEVSKRRKAKKLRRGKEKKEMEKKEKKEKLALESSVGNMSNIVEKEKARKLRKEKDMLIEL